jgi:hypothetical protein
VNGKAVVEITVERLPADGLRRLKALGFTVTTRLRGGSLLRGTAPIAKLEALAALPFVRRVDLPHAEAARR